jgi:glycosyltransferase involved in cell wall biosynthesis
MKLVHVIPALTKGGGEKVVVHLANHAVSVGYQVTIIAAYPVDPLLLQDELSEQIEIRFVSKNFSSKLRKYFHLVLWVCNNGSWLASQDVIHCHLTYSSFLGTLVKLWQRIFKNRRPFVVETYHAVGMSIPRWLRWFHARLISSKDGVVFMAKDPYWSRFLSEHPSLKSKTIPNGISFFESEKVGLNAREAYRKTLGIPDECKFVLGTVGMLRPDREPWRYLPIFSEVAKVFGSEVHFVIAGGGTEKEFNHMRSLVQEYDLEGKVHMPGLVTDSKLPCSIMDLYITLNIGAITGIAALEAAISGLPVLAYQMLQEYQRKSEDWIWSSINPIEIAERAIQLIKSPKELDELAKYQSAYVKENHTSEVMANSYYDFYQVISGSFMGDMGPNDQQFPDR